MRSRAPNDRRINRKCKREFSQALRRQLVAREASARDGAGLLAGHLLAKRAKFLFGIILPAQVMSNSTGRKKNRWRWRGPGTTDIAWGSLSVGATERAGGQILEAAVRILLLTLAIVLGIETLSTAVNAQNYPWCAHYSTGDSGGVNCGFVSLPQCLTNLSGIGGICMRNTQFAPYAPAVGPAPVPAP